MGPATVDDQGSDARLTPEESKGYTCQTGTEVTNANYASPRLFCALPLPDVIYSGLPNRLKTLRAGCAINLPVSDLPKHARVGVEDHWWNRAVWCPRTTPSCTPSTTASGRSRTGSLITSRKVGESPTFRSASIRAPGNGPSRRGRGRPSLENVLKLSTFRRARRGIAGAPVTVVSYRYYPQRDH
jgi:hypothetical protein